MKYRPTHLGVLLAGTISLGSVDSSLAWPQIADLRVVGHAVIVPVQMRGMGGGGMAGMAGGGMAGMAGGGMAGAGSGGGKSGMGGAAGMGGKGGGMASGGMAGGAGMGKSGMGGTGGMSGMGGGDKGGGGGMAGGGMGGNVNIHVHGNSVRPWVRRPYFGTIVGGVALGTVIAATAVPVAPAPNLCWIWSSEARTQGYWDYCTPP